MYLPQIIIVTEWFDTKLSSATGIAVCGSGFGIAVFAYCSTWLIERFDWKEAMLILASTMVLCVVCSFTFTSPKPSQKGTPPKSALEMVEIKTITLEKKPVSSMEAFKRAMVETFNFSIMKDKLFLYYILGNFINSIVYYTPVLITNDRVHRMDLGDVSDGATLMIYYGLANGFARTFFGYFCDKDYVNRTALYGVAIGLMGLVVGASNFATSLVFMEVCYVFMGIFEGNLLVFFSNIVIEMFIFDQEYTLLCAQPYWSTCSAMIE